MNVDEVRMGIRPHAKRQGNYPTDPGDDLKKTCDRHEKILSFSSCIGCFIDSMAVLSASEGCGVLNCPLGEGERGAAQNLLHGVRRRSRMLDEAGPVAETVLDRKSTRLNSSHDQISYAVFCLQKTQE